MERIVCKTKQILYDSVIIGMVVSVVVKKKKGENVKLSEFPLVPVEAVLKMDDTLLTHSTYISYIYNPDTYQWISASKHTECVKPILQRLIRSSVSFVSLP